MKPTDELKYKLALTLIPKIGAITAKKLIAYVGSPEGVFRETTSSLRKIPGIGEYLAGQVSLRDYISEAEDELKRMERYKIDCHYYQDETYPWRLKNCDDGPLLIYYKGKSDFSRSKVLSIVGTRNATSYGRDICEKIVSGLAAKYPDIIVVSGLAYGIDITAHRLAMEYGLDTWAVLAHGLHTIYPSSHSDSASRIMQQGALISDFHSTVKPEKNNFLRRNRIIAGLAEATLVIESAKKGGALITAELASSYNREVLAVPGRVTDIYSRGCNHLIQNNIAALVENANDLETLLNWEAATALSAPMQNISIPLSDEEKLIVACITEEPGLGQEIVSIRTGIPIHKLVGMLLQMELRNWINVLPGNRYKMAVRFNNP